MYVYDIGAYLNTGKAVTNLSRRYVKITVHTPTQIGSSIIRLQEIELYNNVALGKTATATDANSSGEGASNAVDGTTTTHWASTSSGPRWLTVDLGVSKTIKKWIVRNAAAGGETPSFNTRDYKLQVSSNGTTFTNVDTVTSNTSAVTDRNLAGSTGRYFRLYVTTPNQVSGDQIVRIRDFQLFDNGNMVIGKTAAVPDSNSAGETGAQAIDGLVDTHWCSTTSTPDRSINIDLGSSQTFNRWIVKHAGANGEPINTNTRDYDISVSDDNINFTLVDSITSNTANETVRTIGSGKKYTTKYGYDFLKMAATFQGIINRDGPKVYFIYRGSPEIAVPLGFNPDTFWLNQLSASGQILNGKTQITVNNFYTDLYNVFAHKIAGMAVWDENVPSTSNVASTVSGVENLLPVRYDTSAGSLPALWNSPGGRGVIPLTWTVVPNLADRVLMLYNYLYSTATSKDYFVAGDNGAGYLNPTVLPSTYRNTWRTYNQNKFNQFDLDIAGFLISGFTGNLSSTILQDYATFAPNGIGTNSGYDSNLVNGMPSLRVYDFPNGNQPASAAVVEASLNSFISSNPNQHFYAFRTILADPLRLINGVALYQANYPASNVEVVDSYTFFRLYKASGLVVR